jgi:hypothetical protein
VSDTVQTCGRQPGSNNNNTQDREEEEEESKPNKNNKNDRHFRLIALFLLLLNLYIRASPFAFFLPFFLLPINVGYFISLCNSWPPLYISPYIPPCVFSIKLMCAVSIFVSIEQWFRFHSGRGAAAA